MAQDQHLPTLCNNAVLRQATRRLGQLYDAVLAPSGLRATQFGLLVRIDALGGPTPKALASDLVMDLSALGHTLKPLVRDGLVEQIPDESDRRSKRVRLTAAGERKVAATARLWQEAQGRFEAAFGSPERAASLRAILAEIASADFESAFTATRP